MNINELVQQHHERFFRYNRVMEIKKNMVRFAKDKLLRFLDTYISSLGSYKWLTFNHKELSINMLGAELKFYFAYSEAPDDDNELRLSLMCHISSSEGEVEKGPIAQVDGGKWVVIKEDGQTADFETAFEQELCAVLDSFLSTAYSDHIQWYIPE